MRVHPFPFRTRKLSSFLPKILVWRRTGKIGNANIRDSLWTVSFSFYGSIFLKPAAWSHCKMRTHAAGSDLTAGWRQGSVWSEISKIFSTLSVDIKSGFHCSAEENCVEKPLIRFVFHRNPSEKWTGKKIKEIWRKVLTYAHIFDIIVKRFRESQELTGQRLIHMKVHLDENFKKFEKLEKSSWQTKASVVSWMSRPRDAVCTL